MLKNVGFIGVKCVWKIKKHNPNVTAWLIQISMGMMEQSVGGGDSGAFKPVASEGREAAVPGSPSCQDVLLCNMGGVCCNSKFRNNRLKFVDL